MMKLLLFFVSFFCLRTTQGADPTGQHTFSLCTWQQVTSLIDGEVAGDESGKSVSLSTVVFKFDASLGWVQLGGDIDVGKGAGDTSGLAVSLSVN